MGCVNKHSKEFRELASRNDISNNSLELLVHQYWIETGNETLFPTDVYIQKQLGRTQYQESGSAVRRLWELRYNTPKIFTSFDALEIAKTEAQNYFPQDAIVNYTNAKGEYVLVIKKPVSKIDSKEVFFENYDSDALKSFLRRTNNIRNWANETLTDEELKEAIIKAISEDFSNISGSLQLAISNTVTNYTPTSANPLTTQLIDHFKSIGLNVFGKTEMENYLKNHNIESLQQARPYGTIGGPKYLNDSYRTQIPDILSIVKNKKYNKAGTDAVTIDSDNNKIIYLIDHKTDKNLDGILKEGRDGFGIRETYNIDTITNDDIKEILRQIAVFYDYSTERINHVLQTIGLTEEHLSGFDLNDELKRLADSNNDIHGKHGESRKGQDNLGRQHNRNNQYGRENEGNLREEEFLITSKGEIYGFADKDGNIYLDETVISLDHPIHEYTHLWDRAVAKNNPELWKRGFTLMKQTSLWKEVLESDNYGKQWQSMKGMTQNKLESLIASEVHSRLTGEKGKELLNKEPNKKLVNHLKQWLKDFFSTLKETFSKWADKDLDNLKVEDFVNMTLRDLADNINPNSIKALQDTVNGMSAEDLRKTLSTVEQENKDYDLINDIKSSKREPQSKVPQDFIFNDGTKVKAPFKPNSQQVDALNAMSDFIKSDDTSMTLSGYAGTGKTSLMEMIADKMNKDGQSVIFCASTNKAAAVLGFKVSKAGFKASTLNKIFGISVEVDSSKTYNAKNLVNVLKDVDILPGSIVIIDEASMINEANYNILNKIAKENNLKIIYVGDEAQLAPVNESNISKVFRNGDGKVIRLTQVERTDDNAILKEATNIRNGQSLSGKSSFNDKGEGVAFISPKHQQTIEEIISEYTKGLKNNPDFFKILAYTNKAVADYNTQVRKFLGYTSPVPQNGEPMMGYTNWGYDWRTKAYRFINSESYKVVRTGKSHTVSKKLENGTTVTLEAIPLTLTNSLGVTDTFDYIDIKNNSQNRQAATLLANEKKMLWNKVRKVVGRQAKAEIYQKINAIDAFLFVNDNIIDNNGNTLQVKTIDFGYALTIHKSQGSTFTHVLLDDVDVAKAYRNNDMASVIDSEDVNIESSNIGSMETLTDISDEIELGEGTSDNTVTNDINTRQQLEYVAVSRATNTVTVISNNIKKEESPLHIEKKSTVDASSNDNSLRTETLTDTSSTEDSSTADKIKVSLPGYEYFNDLYEDTSVDAEWKILYLKKLDRLLSTEMSPEDADYIINKMNKILSATSEEQYLKQIKDSEETNNITSEETKTALKDYKTLIKQYNDLLCDKARLCGLTATEVRHTAELIMNAVSDRITELKTVEGLGNESYDNINPDFDFLNATRKQIVETVGINRLLEEARQKFAPTNAGYTNIDTMIQAQLIIENWDIFVNLGSDMFALNEGFGIKRNHKNHTFDSTKKTTNIDSDNFNGYENDLDRIAEEEGKDEQEHWQIENKTIDNLFSMSDLVRQGLHQCYQLDNNGNKKLSKWGIPERVNQREAMNSILRWTQGALSLPDMIKKMSERQQQNPWLSQLIKRLSDTTGNETDFQSQFYGVFSKHFQLYSIVLSEDGKYKCIPVNNHPALTQVTKSISTLFKLGEHPLFNKNLINKTLLGTNNTVDKNAKFNLHKALTTLRTLVDKIKAKELIDDTFYKEAALNISGVCSILGYQVSEETLSEIISDENIKSMTNALSIIVSALDNVLQAQKRGEQKNYNPFNIDIDNNIKTALNSFLTPIVDKLENTAVNAFYDSGKMYQSFITPSFMTKLMNKFHQSEESFKEFMLSEYGSSEWFKASSPKYNIGWKNTWLHLLATTENARRIFDHKVELNFNKHNYMRNMSDAEYTLSIMAEYFSEFASSKQNMIPAWFRVPMQSNKPSSEFIKFYSYRGSDYKDSIIMGLHKMFLQELSRIQTVMMRNLSKKDPAFIKNFDTNGRKFNFLPMLNSYLDNSALSKARRNILRNADNTVSADNERLATLLQRKISGTKFSAQEDAELSKLADSVIRQSMENRIQSILDTWQNNGILEAAKKINNITEISDKKNDFTEIRKAVENFLWNDAFASKNILQLTIGDIAFYKDAEDLQKRLAQLHAPGIRGNIYATDYKGNRVSDGKYRTIVLQDFDDFKSNIIANISEVFDRKIAAAPENQKAELIKLKDSLVRAPKTNGEDDKGGKYYNINVTDAQGYSSPSSYRKKAFIFGRWSHHAEDIYQKIKNGSYDHKDLQTAFQPLKPFVYSRLTKKIGTADSPIQTMQVPFQAKNAEYLLIMADAILQGEELSRPNLLRAVYRVMEDSEKINPTMGIDTVQFESAIKSSLQGRINIAQYREIQGGEEAAYTAIMNQIYKEEYKDNTNKERAYKNYNTDVFVHETSYEDYCLQQEVPAHFKEHSQAHGSQIRMIIPSDLDFYTTDAESNQIDNFYEFDDYVEGNKVHKKLNADEFRKEYEEVIAKNIEESISILVNELKLDSKDPKEKNMALSNILINEIQDSPRYGIDLIQACSLDENGEFRIPKGDPIQAKRIEQLINSIIKNRVNKQTIAGGPIVQVSNFGSSKQLHIRFNDREGNLIPLESDYNPSEHENLSYKEYVHRNQGGIAYFEVFMPMWSNDLFEKFSNPDGSIDIDAIEATDPELLKMVSYRIPTEDKYSMAPMKVVGFMPKEAGDAIMLPYELTEIDDSDFDVDKRYVMRKDIPIGLDNEKVAPLLKAKAIESYKNSHNGTITKDIKEDIHNAVWSFLNNQSSKDRKYWSAFEESLNAELDNLKKSRHDIWRTFPHKSGRFYRDNKIVDMSYAVLTNAQTADKILNPGGFDAPKKMGYMVAAYKNPANKGISWSQLQTMSIEELKELSYIDKDLTFADTQIQFYKQNSAAASLIGVFAVNKVAHAVLESNDIFLDYSEINGDHPLTIADFTFEGRIQIDPRADKTGTLIGKTLGSLVSASADAVKDPILNLMNVNMTTAGMLNTMIRLGMTFDDAALFLSQNVIENVLSQFNRENLTNYQSLSKIIEKRIAEYRHNNDMSEGSQIDYEPLSKEELIKGLTSEEHERIDYKVLLAFQKLRKLVDAMKKPTYATRFNSISSAVGPLIIDNLIIEHKMEQFLDDDTNFYNSDGETININNIFSNHPVLKQFANTVGIAKKMFEDMPTGSNSFKNLINTLPSDIADKMYNDKKLLDSFANFYQSYLLVQSGMINPKQLKSYIERFSQWFISKQKDDKTFKEKYPDNALIQAIDLSIPKKGNPFLSIQLTGKDEQQKEVLRNAWIDLYNDNPELSKMLFDYSFFRAGICYSPKTFMALVPTFVKERLVSSDGRTSYIETYRNLPDVSYELVINQFIRNNWNNNKLVPKKSSKHYKVDLKNGRLTAWTTEDVADLSKVSYIKTSVNNQTYLWHLLSEDRSEIIYELMTPLGNNNEYLEISTEDIQKPLNTTTEALESMEESELKDSSSAETESSEDSSANTISESEKAKSIDDFINGIMVQRDSVGLSTNKTQAKNIFENIKENPHNSRKFIKKVYEKMGITINEEEAEKQFKDLC